MELKKEELYSIIGGSFSGVVINGIVRSAQYILDLGRSLGSAIRRIITNRYC